MIKIAQIFSLLLLVVSLGCSQHTKINSKIESSYELLGTWEGICKKSRDQEYLKNVITFSNDISKNALEVYSDSTCNDRIAAYIAEFKLKLGKPIITPNGDQAREDESRLTSFVAIIYSPKTVPIWNLRKECGFNDWELNKIKNVEGNRCILGYKSGDIDYGLVSINKQEKIPILYIQDKNLGDGKTLKTRPKELDRNSPYRKM